MRNLKSGILSSNAGCFTCALCAVLCSLTLFRTTHADPRSICLRAPTHPSLLLPVSSDCRLRLRSLHRRRKHDPFFFGGLISFHAPVQRDRERYTAVQGEFLCLLAPQPPLHLSVDTSNASYAQSRPTAASLAPVLNRATDASAQQLPAPSSLLDVGRRFPSSIDHRPLHPDLHPVGKPLTAAVIRGIRPPGAAQGTGFTCFPPSGARILTSSQAHKTTRQLADR